MTRCPGLLAGRRAHRRQRLADAGRGAQPPVVFGGQLEVGVEHAEQHVARVDLGSGRR